MLQCRKSNFLGIKLSVKFITGRREFAEFVFGPRLRKGCRPLIYTIGGCVTQRPRGSLAASLLVVIFYVMTFLHDFVVLFLF